MINLLMQVRQGDSIDEAVLEQAENAQKDSAGFATVEESNVGKKTLQRQWNDTEIVAQGNLFYQLLVTISSRTRLTHFSFGSIGIFSSGI